MGKTTSKHLGLPMLGFANASSTKRRENPEGGTYILRGCINEQFQASQESLWHSKVALIGSSSTSSTTATAEYIEKKSPDTMKQHQEPGETTCSKVCQCQGAHVPVGFAQDNCQFEVALPPEVSGSTCSLKVVTIDKEESDCTKPPLSPTISSNSGKATVGAVDCDVSLDGESDQQEWAFTLYDFDGHRKVTREDLSSLLKTISEALASTITLPASGSKKLRLRLSVGSEDSADPTKTATPNGDGKENRDEATVADDKRRCHRERIPVALAGNHLYQLKRDGQTRGPTRAPHHQQAERIIPVNQGDYADRRNSHGKRYHRIRRQSAYPRLSDDILHRPHPVSTSSSPSSSPAREHENRERRTYYEELAGIENYPAGIQRPSSQPIGHDGDDTVEYKEPPPPVRPISSERYRGARGSGNHRHTKSSKNHHHHHHRRSRSYDPSTVPPSIPVPIVQQEGVLSTEEHKMKCGLRQRYHKDYHMLLLEASRAKLVGYQPSTPPNVEPTMTIPTKLSAFEPSSPPAKLSTFTSARTNLYPPGVSPSPPLPPDHVATSPKVTPRRHSHKKLRKPPALKPLTYMQHEIANGMEGVVYVPMSQRHDHHHHHEHHHHHHYHHYHK